MGYLFHRPPLKLDLGFHCPQFFSSRHPHSRRLPIPRSLSDPQPDPPPPDPLLQQKLVEIIRLETGKVRVSDYIDERSLHLQGIAEKAMLESDRIAADALKDLDEASSKTIREVDESIQVVEEQLASSRAEIEAREIELDAFEKRLEAARSEGLFFKSLYKPSKRWKDRSLEEQKAIIDELRNIARTTTSSLSSRWRKNIYIFLIFIMVVFLSEEFTVSEVLWSRVVVLGVIVVFLTAQLLFEISISSRKDEMREK